MSSSDLRKESCMQDGGMPSSMSSIGCAKRYPMSSTLSVFLQRKTPPTVFLWPDLSKEIPIGPYTTLILRDGFNAGLLSSEQQWCYSGSTLPTTTFASVHRAPMTKTTSVLRTERPPWSGSVVFGPSRSLYTDNICQPYRENSSSTLTTPVTLSWTQSHPTTSRTLTPPIDTTKAGARCAICASCELNYHISLLW